MDRRAAWVLGIVFGGLFLCLFSFMLLFHAMVSSEGSSHSLSSSSSGEAVGVLEITGVIEDSKKTLKDLRELERDNDIKAVVVRLDSPGGSVGPSQEIYNAILRLKKKKKVVVSMGSLAASGAFYIACAADEVFSNPGTLTGSIGVIMESPNFEGVLKWAGVSMVTIKAGKMKDVGSAFRPMTPEEKQYLESLLEDVHQQFIEAVADGRHLKKSAVEPIADGRVFTGRQAKDLKLVDSLGGFDEAVARAGKLANIKGEPKVHYPKHEGKLLQQLFGEDEADSFLHGIVAKAAGALGASASSGLQYRLPLTTQP